MPIYTFYNKKTKKQYDDMMTIAEMEEYLKKNKHITQVLTGLNMIRPFTFDERKILWDGLREREKTTSELLMEGFKEEQILRKLEEEDD